VTVLPRTTHDDPLHGLSVFERGWLSSNNLLIHAAPGEPGAVLVDTGHVNHAAQTLALVRQGLAGRPLHRVLNTHLHSDHCGGNATLQRAFGMPVHIPPGLAEAVRAWDGTQLSYEATGQRIERYDIHGVVQPGEAFVAGGREWQVLAAPGHDPHSVMFHDADHGVLVSADALWEHGFGVVFPEVAGEPGFDDVGEVLERIAGLHVRVVIPGHGAPFTDVAAALDRARMRLRGMKAEPARHARHAMKVLLKYHLMEEGAQAAPALTAWALATPLLAGLWERHAPPGVPSPAAWVEAAVAELVAGGALRREGEMVCDA
jgi:glyoxylase-like metal-dependent hydrolase (beta-lactamase superfamily II)